MASRFTAARYPRRSLLPALAAAPEQLMDRQARDSPQQVPQRHIDDAQQILRRLGGPEPLPELLPVEGILADQQRPNDV